MITIQLGDGADWYKANWVFRQLAADVLISIPGDSELKSALDQAEALGALVPASMDSQAATRLLRAIGSVAEATLEGRVAGWARTRPDDVEGQRQYLESVAELLALIRRTARPI